MEQRHAIIYPLPLSIYIYIYMYIYDRQKSIHIYISCRYTCYKAGCWIPLRRYNHVMGKGLHYYMYSTLYIFMCITRVLASISVRLFNSNESVCIKVYYYMVVCICIYVIHAPPIELRHDCEERRKSIYVNVYLCIIGNYYYITIVI